MLELFKPPVDLFFETYELIPTDYPRAVESSSENRDINLQYRLLDNDIWKSVFCFTNISDLKNLSAVSKKWRFNVNELCKKMSGNIVSILNEKNLKKIGSLDLIDAEKLIKKHGSFIIENFKLISKKFNTSLQKEFHCLLENEIQNFSTIIKISKAHDVLMTWTALLYNEDFKNIPIEWNIEKLNSIGELIEVANNFKK